MPPMPYRMRAPALFANCLGSVNDIRSTTTLCTSNLTSGGSGNSPLCPYLRAFAVPLCLYHIPVSSPIPHLPWLTRIKLRFGQNKQATDYAGLRW